MRIKLRRPCLLGAMALAGCLLGAVCHAEEAIAAGQDTIRRPAYQRQRVSDRAPGDWHADAKGEFHRPFGKARHSGRRRFDASPDPRVTVSSSWFQRPYPYHLDYYKMRFGGTYEPYYSGGLYGTPQVITSPFYGFGFGHPFGFAPGQSNGFGISLPAFEHPEAQ